MPITKFVRISANIHTYDLPLLVMIFITNIDNIATLDSIITTEIKILQDIIGAPLNIVKQISIIAAEEILKNKIRTADVIEPWMRIRTGSEGLDVILSGGIPINGISEIYGCSGVGKTQFCLQLALQVQLPREHGGLGKGVVYICTEDIFPSKRLNQLANAYRIKFCIGNQFEDHIYVEHLANPSQLKKCIFQRLPFCFRKHANIGLIVIDSIAGAFRSENENMNYIARSQKFRNIARCLENLQNSYGCAILTVNQVADNLNTGFLEPCLGLSWASNVTCRFNLTRHATELKRKFQVVFAPDLPPKSCDIVITPEGLKDA